MGALLHLAFVPFIVYGVFAAASTPYNPCANKKNPINLRVKGCEKLPCDLVQGTDVVAEMDFLVERNTRTLKPDVKADAMGMTVNYPIEQQDACKSLTNGECPLDEGEEVTYRLQMNISPQYPTTPGIEPGRRSRSKADSPKEIDLVVQLSLIDEYGSTLGCFRLPGRVVPPRK